MATNFEYYNDVALLITHYNRSLSLERLLTSFRELKINFNEIIVSDDASHNIHINKIKSLQNEFKFNFVTTSTNNGIGNNINKGQSAITSPYTLYVQEDFIPQKMFKEKFFHALEILKKDINIDLLRFYSYFLYPNLRLYNEDYSLMYYKYKCLNIQKFYAFSCHPHLRRSNFKDKFGLFRETNLFYGSEYNMCISFIKNKGRGLFYHNYQELFKQTNTLDEPSVIGRGKWRQSDKIVIKCLRFVYHSLKFAYSTFSINFIR